MRPLETPLREIVAACLRQQFHGFNVAQCEEAVLVDELVALVGMSRRQEHGTVGISGDRAAVESCLPEPVVEGADLLDWIGELANHLLGRIKMAIGKDALDLRSSTPIVLDSTELHLSRQGMRSLFEVTNGVHRITAWVDFGTVAIDDHERPCAPQLQLRLPGHVELF